MSSFHNIQFRVFPSPESNDFEVRLFVNGQDFIEKHWPDMMGMDPDDVLSLDILAPRDVPHTAMVVRCGCGVDGCGNATVRVSREGDRIIWDSWDGDRGKPPPGTLIFGREQYFQALEQAISDTSWETPDRTAARLLSSIVDHEALAATNLSYQWASGQIRDDAFTVSLGGPPGHHQILIHTSWSGELPELIAQKVAALLREHPNWWPDVEWYGQSPTPPFDGPGWHKKASFPQAT